jgi:hypothetical protein
VTNFLQEAGLNLQDYLLAYLVSAESITEEEEDDVSGDTDEEDATSKQSDFQHPRPLFVQTHFA